MPKISAEATAARYQEIIDACAKLYETMNFRDITIKEISKETTFSRASVYNYFETKEEIFLALFRQEYERWIEALNGIDGALTAAGYASELSKTLEARKTLLKLLSMNMYDMEENSRPEQLAKFKAAYGAAIHALEGSLMRVFPTMDERQRKDFLFAFLPFMYGIWPYTCVTEKQWTAMREAGLDFPEYTVSELVKPAVEKMLGEM